MKTGMTNYRVEELRCCDTCAFSELLIRHNDCLAAAQGLDVDSWLICTISPSISLHEVAEKGVCDDWQEDKGCHATT